MKTGSEATGTMLCFSLRSLSFAQRAVIFSVANSLQHKQVPNLADVVWACASNGHFSRELFDKSSNEAINRIYSEGLAHDLSLILWGYAIAGLYRDGDTRENTFYSERITKLWNKCSWKFKASTHIDDLVRLYVARSEATSIIVTLRHFVVSLLSI